MSNIKAILEPTDPVAHPHYPRRPPTATIPIYSVEVTEEFDEEFTSEEHSRIGVI